MAKWSRRGKGMSMIMRLAIDFCYRVLLTKKEKV